jgi:lipid II isoglutaminyl synthase (glutamine-hydrolysing)
MILSLFSFLIGKVIIFFLRIFGRNATTLPGKIAFMLCHRLPEHLTRNTDVTLITGTNGKTTTTRLLCAIYRGNGHPVISNGSGANLISGITTALIEETPISRLLCSGRVIKKKDLDSDPANTGAGSKVKIVLEIDEGAFGRYAGSLNANVIAVTNLFRDQLDRYGELSRTREMIRKGFLDSPKSRIVLCADDSLSASLTAGLSNRVLFNGICSEQLRREGIAREISTEAGHCVFCGNPYEYKGRSFGHLGDYTCPSCGFTRPLPDLFCAYEHTGNNYYRMSVCLKLSPEEDISISLPIPGEHNVYNALTAIGAAVADGIEPALCKNGIESTQAGFGRMEKIRIGDQEICIILVKNPVGLDRALSFLEQAEDAGPVMFLLNDRIADGTDVSWIWDVDFENRPMQHRYFISGVRCYDMALRLQYAGVPKERIEKISGQFVDVFEQALSGCTAGECFYLLPNYTSLLTLRAYLEKKYRLKGIWE